MLSRLIGKVSKYFGKGNYLINTGSPSNSIGKKFQFNNFNITASIHRNISNRLPELNSKNSKSEKQHNSNRNVLFSFALASTVLGSLMYEYNNRKENLIQRSQKVAKILNMHFNDFKDLKSIESQLFEINSRKVTLLKQMNFNFIGDTVFFEKNSSIEDRVNYIEKTLISINEFPYSYVEGKIGISIADFHIMFEKKTDGLSTVITTPNLILRSITPEYYSYYYQLYSDKDVISTFHDGKPKSEELIRERYLSHWQHDWQQSSPFSSFVILERKSNSFVGNIAVDHRGDNPGESELAYLIAKGFWGRGYAKEAVNAVLNHYLPLALFLGCNSNLRNKDFTSVVATVRLDNLASKKILEQNMSLIPNSRMERYGAERQTYVVHKEELICNILSKNIEIDKTENLNFDMKENNLVFSPSLRH